MRPSSVSWLRKDYSSKSVMASVVPVEGASNEFPAKRIHAFIRQIWLEATRFGFYEATRNQHCRTCWWKWVADASQQRPFTRSHLWDRQLRMEWPKEECRLLKGRFGC